MAVHSARPFRTGWITAATCSCLLAGGVGWQPATSRAQIPASPGKVPQVEMWQGNQRIGKESSPVRSTLKPVEPISVTPLSTPLESVGLPLPPVGSSTPWTPPPPVPSVKPVPTPTITPVAATKVTKDEDSEKLKALGKEILRSTSKLADDCHSALDSCKTSLLNSGDRFVESLTPSSTRQRAEKSTTTVVVHPTIDRSLASYDREESLPWYKVVWLQVIVGGSALVVGPLMVALMLGLILRRSGMQFRVEVVNSGQLNGQGIAYGVSRIDTTVPDARANPIGRIDPDLSSLASVAALEATSLTDDEINEPEHLPEKFDLGPSYEEERQAKEEALLLREQAILQEIFEENLKLQLELREQQEASPSCDEENTYSVPVVPVEESTDKVSDPIGYLIEEQDQTV